MGSQSPSQPLDVESISKASFNEHGEAALDSYNAWKVMHPSALDAFDKMVTEAKGKSIVVFLDYDGTLSPIVKNPDEAVMSDEMRSAVREVANFFPTAIVSGRSRKKVTEFVKLHNVTYAGSRGMDILPSTCSLMYHKHQPKACDEKCNEVSPYEPAKEFLPAIQKIIQVLKEKVMAIVGANVEDNKFCISVHYRCVNKEDVDTLKEMVESVVEDYPDFHITEGRKVIEIRPSINWNKGHAMKYLFDTLGFNDSNTLLIYLGDDKIDEDAFQVIKRKGQGFPIVVSNVAKKTTASYSLRDPDNVKEFLTRLVEWKKTI